MDFFKKSVQTGFEKVRNYSLSLVSGEKDALFNIQAEDSYVRDIMYSLRKLHHINVATTEEKVESIRRIGIVSWMGGPQALKKAGSQVTRFIKLYQFECYEVKIEIIKALSQICSLNRECQQVVKNEGFLREICDTLKMNQQDQMELYKWLIYAIICMITDNVENQRFVLSIPSLKETVGLYRTETWYSWKRNEANTLFNMLGYSQC